MKLLADFEVDTVPTIEPAVIATLAAGGYLRTGDPVVLWATFGTGKSHLLIGLRLAAFEAALGVRYVTAAQLDNELAELSSNADSPGSSTATDSRDVPDRSRERSRLPAPGSRLPAHGSRLGGVTSGGRGAKPGWY